MEARKAVAEQLGWTIEGRYICRRFDDGTTDNYIATIAEDVAFNLCVSLQERVDVLEKALQEAKDHLEYCNYGDKWERECAYHQKLPERIDAALFPKEPATEVKP